ncbi:hypothetical protein Tco_0178560, partial [Tanacetum coccineum]
MKNLKNQLQDLKQQHKQKRITSLIDDPWRLPSTPFVGVSFNPQSLPQSYNHTTSPSLNIWASEQRRLKPSTKKDPTFSQESQSIADIVASTKTPDVLLIQGSPSESGGHQGFLLKQQSQQWIVNLAWGNDCGSNETPTKGVDGNLHGSSRREVVVVMLARVYVVMVESCVVVIAVDLALLLGTR